MANPHVVGIQIQVTSGGTQASDALGKSLERIYDQLVDGNKRATNAMNASAAASRKLADSIRTAMQSSRRETDRATVGMIHFNQAVASATTGFSHMYRYGLSTLRAVGGALSDITTDSASRLDTTMANLDIVLGRIGNNSSQAVEQSYNAALGRIRELAMGTQFTMEEVGDSFTRLFQAGFTAQDAIGTLDSVLGFSTASAGAVGLEEAASLAALSVTALGSSVEDIRQNFGQMMRATQETRLQMGDFATMFQSMQTSSATFSASTTEDLLAVVGAQRQMGRSVAQSGNDLANTARSMGYLVRALSAPPGAVGGMRTGRMRQQAALMLGVELSDITDEQGNYRDLISMIERVGEKFGEAAERLGPAEAEAWLQALFGSQQARNLIVNSRRYQETYGRSIRDLAGTIGNSGDILEDAQQRVLDTLQGKIALVSGVWDNLKAEIGMMMFPEMKAGLTGLFDVLARFSDVVRQQPDLVRRVTGTVLYFTTLIGVLTAVAGAGMLVGTMMMVTAPLMTALGAGGVTLTNILKQMWLMGMRPLLLTLGPLLVTFLALTVAFDGFMNAVRRGNGPAGRMIGWLREMTQMYGLMLRISSADGLDLEVWESLSKEQQNMVRGWRRFVTTAQDSFREFVAGLKALLSPIHAIGAGIANMLGTLTGDFRDFLITLGMNTSHYDEFRSSTMKTAYALGVLVGFTGLLITAMYAMRFALAVVGVAYAAVGFILKVFTIAFWKSIWASTVALAKFLLFIAVAFIVVKAVKSMIAVYKGLSPPLQKVMLGVIALGVALSVGAGLMYIWYAASRTLYGAIKALHLAMIILTRGLLLLKGAALLLAFGLGYILGGAMQDLTRYIFSPFKEEIQSIIELIDTLMGKTGLGSFSRLYNSFMESGFGQATTLAANVMSMGTYGTAMSYVHEEITRPMENQQVLESVGIVPSSQQRRESEWSGVGTQRPQVDQTVDASLRIDSLTIQAPDASEAGARALLNNFQEMWGRNVSRELARTMQTG